MTSSHFKQRLNVSHIGLIAGPIITGLLLLIGAPAELQVEGHAFAPAWVTLCLLILMAIWWITEALPIPVTALLPLVVLPLFGVASISQAAQPYMHPIVVLLMGGFIFAKAIEHWRLHERIALNIVNNTSGTPAKIIGGFMLASALLSMWISNTATSIMMMPIALSVATALIATSSKEGSNFTIALLLGIAYACSIGGLATPIGSPTNLIVIGYLSEYHNMNISFAQWLLIGGPVVILLLPLTWYALTRWIFKIPSQLPSQAGDGVKERLKTLGTITKPEKRIIAVFVVIASLWAFKNLFVSIEIGGFRPFSGLSDHVTAIIAVLLCFILPSGNKEDKNERLLTWKAAESIPWGVVLLFGGGMSLAFAITETGLSRFLGESLSGIGGYHTIIIILITALMVLMLTEVTSNIATASAVMPIIGAMAIEIGLPIETLAIPVALAAGCAFMLPMATGPNAVVFATGQMTLVKMAKVGFFINIIALVIITLFAFYIGPFVMAL